MPRLNQLPTDATPQLNDVLMMQDGVSGVTKQTTVGEVVSLASGSSGVSSVNTRTGAVTLDKTDVGLSNVDNTSDANKPVSSATQTALNAKANDNAVLHQTGDETKTGSLTIDGSAGGKQVTFKSSFAGGDDNGSGTDSTTRLNLQSYQRAGNNKFGETIRNYLLRKDAKAMTAWYLPVAGFDALRNAITTSGYQAVIWTGAHFEANDHNSLHCHWEVEAADSQGQLQGRLTVLYGDPSTGTIGLDRSIIGTNISDFHFQAVGADHTGATQQQFFRIMGASGTEKAIEWNNGSVNTLSTTTLNSTRRWKIAQSNEAETGSNAGSNWYINRYADDGTLLDSPIKINRSTGQVRIATSGGLDANGNKITSVGTPIASTDAANKDYADKVIPGLSAGSPLATAGQGYLFGPGVSPWQTASATTLVSNGTANNLKVTQFICPVTVTINKVSVNVTTAAASNTGNVAIYSAAGTKLLDASFSVAATGNVTATLGSSVTLYAGTVYQLATSSTSNTAAVNGVGMSSGFQALFDAVNTRVGYPAALLSGTTMPASIGALTGANFSIGCPLFEP